MLLKFFHIVEGLVALPVTQAVPVSLHQVRLRAARRPLDDMHGLRQAFHAGLGRGPCPGETGH